MTEKIRARAGVKRDHPRDVSWFLYIRIRFLPPPPRVQDVYRNGLEREKRTTNRTFFTSCMIQPQYLISSAASAKLYLLMVMLFRGTYLFILCGMLG